MRTTLWAEIELTVVLLRIAEQPENAHHVSARKCRAALAALPESAGHPTLACLNRVQRRVHLGRAVLLFR
jgi:hypothetical protein